MSKFKSSCIIVFLVAFVAILTQMFMLNNKIVKMTNQTNELKIKMIEFNEGMNSLKGVIEEVKN